MYEFSPDVDVEGQIQKLYQYLITKVKLTFSFWENLCICCRSEEQVRKAILYKKGLLQVEKEMKLTSVLKKLRFLETVMKLQIPQAQQTLIECLANPAINSKQKKEDNTRSFYRS